MPTETTWKPIKMAGVSRLVNLPPPRAWRWEKRARGRGHALALVAPTGRSWEFRLRHGAWVKPWKKSESDA